MNVPLLIARRYLFAPKRHNVINVISAISAAGLAIGTAALILILSVYNGFDNLIRSNLSDISPDLLMVSPDGSARFVPDSVLMERLLSDGRTASVSCEVEDNVFMTYGDRQGIARAKGVDESFHGATGIAGHIREGSFLLHKGDVPGAIAGSTLAARLGIHPRFVDPLVLYYPDKDARISVSNPAAAARSCTVFPTGIMSISADTDAELLIIPLHVMRTLTGCPEQEVSGVAVMLNDASPRQIRKFKKDYDGQCRLLDRYQQHPVIYKMMSYEKAAVFLILLFVVLILALNIYGSLSMLIIEKQEDISTLRALGAGETMIRRIFLLEGWLISMSGIAAGLIAGVGLSLIQQYLGPVKMPGNYLIDSYPVVMKLTDIIGIVAGVSSIGFAVAFASSRIRKR